MSESFPPVQGPTPPLPLTSFVGRDQEIATVCTLLGRPDVRLLTLTGPGGIGKTRLALRVMERMRDTASDGVTWVSLAPIRDAELIPSTIAQSLNVPNAVEPPTLERIVSFLSERQMLLVLDNLEHLSDTAAPVVSDLLSRCPALKVLTTSRVLLRISGEHVVPVSVLDQASARALFAVRATTVDPGFEITPDTAPVIDAICDQVDRLPLAIELAAVRVNVLPPRALLDRLDQRLDLLSGGPRDAPDRQRDMRATIAWSDALLTDTERSLFRRLGIFVGGFTLDAAEVVAGEGMDALAGVSALVAASLVNTMASDGDQARFIMLETIRDYALERLAKSGEEPSVRHAHAHYLVTLAEHGWDLPIGSGFDSWLNRLQPEIDNFRLALDWALNHEPSTALQLAGALMDFWSYFVRLSEGQAWIHRALASAPETPSRHRTRALVASGWLALDQGDLTVADVSLTEAHMHARELEDESALILSLSFLGQLALARGETEQARVLYQDALKLVEHANPLSSTAQVAIATMNLGHAVMAAGDLAEARDLLEQALNLHMQGSGPIGVAFGHLFLGELLLAEHDEFDASAHFLSAFRAFARASHVFTSARALEGLAAGIVSRNPREAIRLLAAATVILGRGDYARDWLGASIYAHTLETARDKVGETAFAEVWNHGTDWTWEEVCGHVVVLEQALSTEADPVQVHDHAYGLSAREVQVLHLVAAGHSNRAIGGLLFVGDRTIENHVRHILNKLGLDSRTAAATWAVRRNLV